MNDPVLIIGGGLAGLTLANVLKHHGIPYKVFERDHCPTARDQGWSISLHFCLGPLSQAMDPAKYATLGPRAAVNPQEPFIQGFKIIDGATCEPMIQLTSDDVPRQDSVRINRNRFREWLLDGIEVQWNKVMDHYTVLETGGVEVLFKDGTLAKGSCLVGADGVNSSVCRQLLGPEAFSQATSVNPVHILASARWVDRATREQLVPLGRTNMLFTAPISESESCFGFLSLNDVDVENDRYQYQWSISRYDPEGKLPKCTTDHERLQQAKSWADQYFTGILRSLITETPEPKITQLCVRERSPSQQLLGMTDKPVVLIGDAAHTMTMYRGEGGNHAILDAVLLGLALSRVSQGKQTLQQALEDYYNEMIPRGTQAVDDSHKACEQMHGPQKHFKAFVAAIANQIAEKLKKSSSPQ